MKGKNKKDNNKENKICFILHTFTATLFTLSGILNLVTEGVNKFTGFTNIALGVTFGCIAYMYYKKYKEGKEEK